MNSDFVTGHVPPQVRSQKQVIRVKGTDPVHLVCVSDKAEGLYIHWIGGHSVECPGDEVCDHCRAGVGKKWKGYLDCITMGPRSYTLFLEVTPTAFEIFTKQLESGKSMRGVYFTICKTKGGAKGRYVIEVKERRIEEQKLPAAESARPLLRKLWAASKAKRVPSSNGDGNSPTTPDKEF